MKTRERQEKEEEPAGVHGMVTRKAFGLFRRRLNGERRLTWRENCNCNQYIYIMYL